jgi:hypothetical protein
MQVEDCMKTAFKPFEQYRAEGKLDGYLNSIDPEDKAILPGIKMSTDINLLRHDLGENVHTKIGELFDYGTMYVVWNLDVNARLHLLLVIYSTALAQARPDFRSMVFATSGDFIFHADARAILRLVGPSTSTSRFLRYHRRSVLGMEIIPIASWIMPLSQIGVFILVRRTPWSTKRFDISTTMGSSSRASSRFWFLHGR